MALWSPESWPLAASSTAVPKTEQEYAEQLLLSARSAATQSTDSSSVGALVPRLRSLRAALGSNDDGWSAAGTPRQLVDAFSARIASALRDPTPLPAAAEEPDEEAPPTDGGLSSRRQALLLPHIARQLVGQVVTTSERMEARRLATESCKDACAAYRGSMLRATSRVVHPSEGPSVGERLRTGEQTALEAALDAVGANHRAALAPRGAGAAAAGAAAAGAAAGPAAADSSQALEAALCAQAAVAVRRALGPTIRAQVRASLARRAALLSDGTARERAGVVAVRLAMHELEQQAAEAVGEVVARTLERARATTTRALQQAQAEAEALATDRAGWRLKLLREPVPLAPAHSSAPGGGAAAAAAPPPPTAAAAATGDSAAGAAEEAARRQLSRRRDELQLHVDEYGRAYEEEFGAPRARTHTHTHTTRTHLAPRCICLPSSEAPLALWPLPGTWASPLPGEPPPREELPRSVVRMAAEAARLSDALQRSRLPPTPPPPPHGPPPRAASPQRGGRRRGSGGGGGGGGGGGADGHEHGGARHGGQRQRSRSSERHGGRHGGRPSLEGQAQPREGRGERGERDEAAARQERAAEREEARLSSPGKASKSRPARLPREASRRRSSWSEGSAEELGEPEDDAAHARGAKHRSRRRSGSAEPAPRPAGWPASLLDSAIDIGYTDDESSEEGDEPAAGGGDVEEGRPATSSGKQASRRARSSRSAGAKPKGKAAARAAAAAANEDRLLTV